MTRPDVEAFVADPSHIGNKYVGQYVVFTTSGSTGVPAILDQDRGAQAGINGLAYGRGVGVITACHLWQVLRRGGRQAAIVATDGHVLNCTPMERRLCARPVLFQLLTALALGAPPGT